jgi:hypothetical protein
VADFISDTVILIEDQGDAFKHAFEAGSLLFQMAQTGGGDLIGADPAVGGGDTPLGLHELRFEQAPERRIERSFFHLEQVVRSLLDVLDERVPVGGLASKRLENHHFECTGNRSRGGEVFIGYTATGID